MVREAEPAIGRTRTVEVLRGGRSKVVLNNGYDELPGYGEFNDWTADDLHARGRCAYRRRHAALDRRSLPEAGAHRARGLMRIAVLASGAGTNLQAILDDVHGRDGVEVVAVGSDKPEAQALERARSAGIETAAFPSAEHSDREARDGAMGDWLEAQVVELVVLAGYMQLLSPAFVQRFARRLINVHPALLPSFTGLDAIGQALDYGVRVTGVTVHFVDEGVDTGPVLLQRAVTVPPSRNRDELEETIHAVEHELLPEAIRLIASGRVSFDDQEPRIVRISA